MASHGEMRCTDERNISFCLPMHEEGRKQCTYMKQNDWVFASGRYRGRRPYRGQAILRKYVRPVARRVGIQNCIGWHTSRHFFVRYRVIASAAAPNTAREAHACQQASSYAGRDSSAAMTRSKNKRPPNAFLFKSFNDPPLGPELPEALPRIAVCFSFSPIGLRPPQSGYRRIWLPRGLATLLDFCTNFRPVAKTSSPL